MKHYLYLKYVIPKKELKKSNQELFTILKQNLSLAIFLQYSVYIDVDFYMKKKSSITNEEEFHLLASSIEKRVKLENYSFWDLSEVELIHSFSQVFGSWWKNNENYQFESILTYQRLKKLCFSGVFLEKKLEKEKENVIQVQKLLKNILWESKCDALRYANRELFTTNYRNFLNTEKDKKFISLIQKYDFEQGFFKMKRVDPLFLVENWKKLELFRNLSKKKQKK